MSLCGFDGKPIRVERRDGFVVEWPWVFGVDVEAKWATRVEDFSMIGYSLPTRLCLKVRVRDSVELVEILFCVGLPFGKQGVLDDRTMHENILCTLNAVSTQETRKADFFLCACRGCKKYS